MKDDQRLAVANFSAEEDYLVYLESSKVGMRLASTPYGESPKAMMADGADFYKWMMQRRPDVPVTKQDAPRQISLHSNDIWLPLLYLASETSVQVAVGIICDYVKEKLRGHLPSDRPNVNISIVFEDKKSKVTRKFDFSGDVESLAKAVKRFDLDNFFK